MKRVESSIVVGVALVGAGVLFLMQSLGLLGPVGNLLWGLLFAVGGGTFLTVFAFKRAHWWALIPGWTLLGLAALLGLQDIAPALAGAWGGALFMGAISLGFWTMYLTGRERWWAVIPGGVLLTLALIAGLAESAAGADLGWVFFLGLALTFGLVTIVPTPKGRLRWAIYPAGGLLVMALLVFAASGELLNILWPLALILAGLVLAYRALRPVPRLQAASQLPPAPALGMDRDDGASLEREVGALAALEPPRKEAV